jgi:predicted HTH domain antitoxin
MTITFELPNDIEQILREELGSPDDAVKEAALVELYRQRKISHAQISHALGRSRYETDGILKRHGVYYDLTVEDVVRQATLSEEIRSRE